MDLRRLEALVALEREGTMNAAAESLGCGQPTISHHLRRLEEETGAVLVQRVGRGVRLTVNGARLAARGREIIALVRQAELELDAATTLASGRVRLAAFPSACTVIVPRLLSWLRVVAPGLCIDFVAAEPPEAADMLRAGTVDVAIAFAYSGQSFDEGITTQHMGWDELHLVESAGHPQLIETGHGPIEPKELRQLAGARWVAGCERCRTGLVDLCESVGVEPAITFTSDDGAALQALVASNFGVTLLPGLALLAHRDPGVVTRPVHGAGRELLVATFGEVPRPAAVEEVVRSLLAIG